MNRNIKVLKLAVIAILVVFYTKLNATEASGKADSLARAKAQIELNTIINPMLMPFLGGTSYRPIFGLQLKIRNAKGAWRYSIDHQYGNTFLFSNSIVVGAVDGGVRYLSRNIEAKTSTASFGYERSKMKSWGRMYLGADLGFLYNMIRLSASNYDRYFENDSIDWQFDYNKNYPVEIDNFGGVVKPFIGLGINLGKHFGINIEGRTDLRMMTHRSYQIMDDSEIIIGPRQFSFRTLPFIDFRLSYTFGNGRK